VHSAGLSAGPESYLLVGPRKLCSWAGVFAGPRWAVFFPLSRAHEWAEVQRQEKVGLRPKMNRKHVSVYCFSEAVLKEFCLVFFFISIQFDPMGYFV
jgi:hypothetical protein